MVPKATSASAICALALVTTAAWGQVNVARDRPYQCNVEVLSGWTGLVDGVTDSDAGRLAASAELHDGVSGKFRSCWTPGGGLS